MCWSWTIFWQESIARGTHLDHVTSRGDPFLQILLFLNPDKVWGHVIGFNFSEHWFSLYQALIPRCFLQCFHSQFDEDFSGKIVGWKDNGTVAFGFLRNLLNLNKLIYYLYIFETSKQQYQSFWVWVVIVSWFGEKTGLGTGFVV